MIGGRQNDSSPLSESTLFSSLIVNIFDEWDQIAPALVHQDAPVATVQKWCVIADPTLLVL